MQEIAFLCHNWKGDDTHDVNWQGKSAINNPTSPITDTKLLPSPHLSQSRVQSSDEQTTLETHTQSATEKLSTHMLGSAVECTVLLDPSGPATTPVSESFITTSCDEVVPISTPVGTAAVQIDAELQVKDVEMAGRGDLPLVASDEDCEAAETTTCTDEGAPTMVSYTAEESPTMISCSERKDCNCSETVKNSTSDENSRSTTRAVRLPSDIIYVSPIPSPVLCISTSPDSEMSPGRRQDDVCLSGASSDEILLCSPPTPSVNLLRETELSPRHVVNLSRKLSLPCVTTNLPTSPTASDSSACTTDWLVTRSPPHLQVRAVHVAIQVSCSYTSCGSLLKWSF